MKSKKILSLIFVLCVLLSVLSLGIVSVSAEEHNEPPAKVGADVPKEVASSEYADKWLPHFGTQGLSSEEKSIFYSATEDASFNIGDQYAFYPMQVIATQSNSSSTDYAFLTYFMFSDKQFEIFRKNKFSEEVLAYKGFWWEIVSISVNKDGVASLGGYYKVELDDVKTFENGPEAHAWNTVAKKSTGELEKETEIVINSIISSDTNMKFTVSEVLGTKEKGSGKELRTLCYGTTTTGDAESDLYIIDIYIDNTNAEILKMEAFNLDNYLAFTKESNNEENEASDDKKSVDESTENQSDDAEGDSESESTSDTQQNSENNSTNNQNNSGQNNSGGNNTQKSPNTGYPVAIVILLLLIAAGVACVSVKAITNKND